MTTNTLQRNISDREKALSMEKPRCYSKNNELKLDNFPASSYNTVPPQLSNEFINIPILPIFTSFA